MHANTLCTYSLTHVYIHMNTCICTQKNENIRMKAFSIFCWKSFFIQYFLITIFFPPDSGQTSPTPVLPQNKRKKKSQDKAQEAQVETESHVFSHIFFSCIKVFIAISFCEELLVIAAFTHYSKVGWTPSFGVSFCWSQEQNASRQVKLQPWVLLPAGRRLCFLLFFSCVPATLSHLNNSWLGQTCPARFS